MAADCFWHEAAILIFIDSVFMKRYNMLNKTAGR